MFQIRIHGRGGQGVVSGAEMLSVAAFLEGRYAQAFPSASTHRHLKMVDQGEIPASEPLNGCRCGPI